MMTVNIHTESVNSILFKALKIEEFGQTLFSTLARLLKDREAKSIFKRLAEEEENHYYLLSEALRINGGNPKDAIRFKPDALFYSDIENLMEKGSVEVFQYAIETEQRVIDYYERSLKYIDDTDTRKMIRDLIEFEENHKRILTDQMNRSRSPKSKALDMNANMPAFVPPS